MGAPSTTAGNGRDRGGRFGPGNTFAKGNPHAARVAKLRTAALQAETAKDLRGIIRKLVALALGGDVTAAHEVLQRTLGPPGDIDLQARLEALEQALLEER